MKHLLKSIDKGLAKSIDTKENSTLRVIEIPLYLTVSEESANEVAKVINENTVWELLNKIKP